MNSTTFLLLAGAVLVSGLALRVGYEMGERAGFRHGMQRALRWLRRETEKPEHLTRWKN